MTFLEFCLLVLASVAAGVVLEGVTGLGRRIWQRFFPASPTQITFARNEVEWVIESDEKRLYRLRNGGTGTATNVTIDPPSSQKG